MQRALPRREFLAASLTGLGAIPSRAIGHDSFGSQLTPGFGRAKRCILLFLTGGPPQHDTWDMKPAAPREIRGELSPISSSVPGLQVSELFPKLSQLAHKYCIVRAVSHGDTVHTSAGYTMLTGVVHPKANSATATLIQPNPNDFPHIGAVVTRHFARVGQHVPVAVSVPEFIRDANVNDFPGQDAGFLGKSYAPLLVEADADRRSINPTGLRLPSDVSGERLRDRANLARSLRSDSGAEVQIDRQGSLDVWRAQALSLLQTSYFHDAFQLESEPKSVAESYGAHLFGKCCLVGRRLLEAGVKFVTAYWHYEGPDDSPVWDSHWNNFKHLRERLMPPTDQAVSALLTDLSRRGMLDDTLVVCLGEFGRTPKINNMAGRDHWPHVQSIMLAGAGIPPGAVFGSSDAQGAFPNEHRVSPADLHATFLHLLGVPHSLRFNDRTGREFGAYHGHPVTALLS